MEQEQEKVEHEEEQEEHEEQEEEQEDCRRTWSGVSVLLVAGKAVSTGSDWATPAAKPRPSALQKRVKRVKKGKPFDQLPPQFKGTDIAFRQHCKQTELGRANTETLVAQCASTIANGRTHPMMLARMWTSESQ